MFQFLIIRVRGAGFSFVVGPRGPSVLTRGDQREDRGVRQAGLEPTTFCLTLEGGCVPFGRDEERHCKISWLGGTPKAPRKIHDEECS